MDNLFAQRIWGIPWTVVALVALGIALFYVVVDSSHGASGPVWFVLRWFHSLCWILLMLAALAMARVTPLPVDWAKPLAVTGGLVYAAFIVTALATGKLFA